MGKFWNGVKTLKVNGMKRSAGTPTKACPNDTQWGKIKNSSILTYFGREKTVYINAIYNRYGHWFYKLVTGLINKN